MSRKFTPHRKIWESHFGKISKDSLGITYDIHHIDGDKSNNDITNLACLSIHEHYEIHYWQEDWGACAAITLRMEINPEEISILNSKAAIKRINDGTSPFLNGAGNKMIQCTYCEKVCRAVNHSRWHGDNCNKNPNQSSDQSQRDRQREIYKNSNINDKIKCDHCLKIISRSNYARWHGNNCKENLNELC